ncbi:UNVERIFIED_CONTAM: hypothetical protein K2H54_047675 [Gekko kuhli]
MVTASLARKVGRARPSPAWMVCRLDHPSFPSASRPTWVFAAPLSCGSFAIFTFSLFLVTGEPRGAQSIGQEGIPIDQLFIQFWSCLTSGDLLHYSNNRQGEAP